MNGRAILPLAFHAMSAASDRLADVWYPCRVRDRLFQKLEALLSGAPLTWRRAAAGVEPIVRDAEVEIAVLALQDAQQRVVVVELAEGSEERVEIDMDTVVRHVRRHRAERVVLLHTHAGSADCEPSQEDKKSATEIRKELREEFPEIKIRDVVLACGSAHEMFSGDSIEIVDDDDEDEGAE